MKIGIACNTFSQSGGMERYTLDITKAFIAAGHGVEIYTKKFDPKLAQTLPVSIHRCHCFFIPGKLRDWYFSLWLRLQKKKFLPDILLGCCRNDSSDVAICGGTHIGFIKETGKQKKISDQLTIALERRFYQNAKAIVAHSKLMRKELEQYYGVDVKKIRVIYPPINTDTFHPVSSEERARLREKFHFPKDKKVFLFVSSSHKRKGFPLLEKFFEQTDLPVLLAVAGRPLNRTYKNIVYLGYAKNIAELYQASDFSVLASDYEPFGLAGVESVLCGTPAVLADNIGCCELLPPSSIFKFKKSDVSSLTAAIQNAIVSTNKTDYAELQSQCQIQHHIETLERLAKNKFKFDFVPCFYGSIGYTIRTHCA